MHLKLSNRILSVLERTMNMGLCIRKDNAMSLTAMHMRSCGIHDSKKEYVGSAQFWRRLLAGHPKKQRSRQDLLQRLNTSPCQMFGSNPHLDANPSSKTTDLTSTKVLWYSRGYKKSDGTEQNDPRSTSYIEQMSRLYHASSGNNRKSTYCSRHKRSKRTPTFRYQSGQPEKSTSQAFTASANLADMGEIYTQGSRHFLTQSKPQSQFLKNPKKKVTPLPLPYDDDYVLGNLKFVPKGESVEVFGMAIPDPLITEAIQQSSYYPMYLKMVAENQSKTPQESQPATKRATPKKPYIHHTSQTQTKPAPSSDKETSKPNEVELEKTPQKKEKEKVIKLNMDELSQGFSLDTAYLATSRATIGD
ncbi:hypothetical protein Tco_1554641 [Tanacetum coccineum]